MLIKIRHYFVFSLVLIGLDQLTKLWAYNAIGLHESIYMTDFFALTQVHNYGAAFSFLADESGWQRYVLSAISAIASGVIVVWMLRTPSQRQWTLLALCVLLAGAIGNLIDRLFLGFVIDFIDLHYQDFYWPVFNVADILISVGVALLLFADLKKS